ncbi:MAG TPA: hypothetical protein VKU93_04515 [Terracidiphilus sp.]|jgi:uncharacterized coiled-coil protein SlyX|nr:hypothetical protein [Terracidiphilus sp.]
MAEILLEQAASEAEPETEPGAQTGGPQALAMSADDFSALEERVLRAVALVRRERQARLAAEERAARLEAQLAEQTPRLEQMEGEVAALRAERDTVRQRVERLLSQLDALEI